MRITKISVKGLFGMFDHEIPLNQESRITILHGPNGVGKTVLMQMVNAFFQYDYEYIAKLPFEQFHISFIDGKTVSVEPRQVNEDEDDTPTIVVNCTDDTGENLTPFVPSAIEDSDLNEQVAKLNPALIRVTILSRTQYWLDLDEIDHDNDDLSELERLLVRIGVIRRLAAHGIYPEVYSKADLLRKYPSLLAEAYGEPPAWLVRIQEDGIPQLIGTARLTNDVGKDALATFYLFRELWEMIPPDGDPLPFMFPGSRDAVQDVAADYRIPVDYFNTLQQQQEYEQLLDELHNALLEDAVKRSETATNLLEEHYSELYSERADLELDPNYLSAKLFIDIINERFLFKTLGFNDDEKDDKKLEFIADDGSIVSHADLSSGEQQILVLYHQLLVETESDTLVMIDEPEISMNVVWQRNFLKDLQRIVELRKFDVLIATHSPQIIHDKWDWMVPLGSKIDSDEAD